MILFVTCSAGYSVAQDDPESARILNYEFDNTGTGPYKFSFDSSDGINREESGVLEHAGTDHEYVKVTGSFSYPGPDGKMYEVRYTADDQGFHPEGDHFMVPPFVPWIHHHHHDHEEELVKEATQTPEHTSGDRVLDTNRTPATEYLPSSPSEPVGEDFSADIVLSSPRPVSDTEFLSIREAPEGHSTLKTSTGLS